MSRFFFLKADQMTNQTRQFALASSPFRADGTTIWKDQHGLNVRGSEIAFLPYPLARVNDSVEDPEGLARRIAAALNADAILKATQSEPGKSAVTWWLHAYLKGASLQHHSPQDIQPQDEPPLDALAAHRDAEACAKLLIARHGLLPLIIEASRRLAETSLSPSKTG